MKYQTLPFDQIPQFSHSDVAYTMSAPALRPFYEHEVNLEAFEKVIQQKSFAAEKRIILVQALEEQYETIEASAATLENIQRLKSSNAYTVVTAHQPNLFTGPLYVIYKIISALNLAESLQEKYPEQHFVPVFWTGGEDHDFEEVNHLHLFGKTITWEGEQGGSVGRYQLDSLTPVLEEVKAILGDGPNALELVDRLEAYFSTTKENPKEYGLANRQLINWIFAEYGLVILDAGKAVFKQQMIPIFKEELLENTSKALVDTTGAALEAAGFQQQAFTRPINLFYLSENARQRIEQTETGYQIVDSDLTFSKAALLQELEQHPERFSPNVILRPLFQESILPNLAYIGGGGELAYWLERKTQFEHYGLPFPMLIRRCSVLWVDEISAKRLEKLGLNVTDLLGEIEVIVKDYVLENTEEELSLATEMTALNQVFEQIVAKAAQVDPGLEKGVLAQQVQMQKSIDKLEQRLVRAEKKNQETALKQLRKLKEKLFPNRGLQERHDNFLDFYSRYGRQFIQVLKEKLHPLDKKFLIIEAEPAED